MKNYDTIIFTFILSAGIEAKKQKKEQSNKKGINHSFI